MSYYPNIQTTGEVSQGQLAKLDITRRIEFQKYRNNLIGEGFYGQVYSGWYTRSTGEKIPVAIKILMCTPENRRKVEERLLREILTWKRVSQHENVADFMGIYRTAHDPPYLVLPYYRNNNLLRYAAMRHPSERITLAKDIARGLNLLHENNVIHGDIKPENILVSDHGKANIADFGVSVIPDLRGFTTDMSRNVRHSAPELIPISNHRPPKPTRESDVYSLGILFLQLFDGRINCTPYEHVQITSRDPGDTCLLKRIHQGDRPRRENHPTISSNCWAILEACWAADPRARPSLPQIRSWLNRL